MDLFSFTSGAIGVINPLVPLQIQVSTGYTTGPNGKRTPSYAAAVTYMGQVQPLSSKDLRQIDGLNLQGTLEAIYIDGDISGIIRSLNKGGDIITDPSGNVWLVNQVLEHWPDWTKVVATLQNGS